jgi:DNA polymerase elongation subunit (family B)
MICVHNQSKKGTNRGLKACRGRYVAGWFQGRDRWQALRHLSCRAKLNLALLDELDFISRTSELAKTFGIDWHSVVSRGSQYRVESMLARLAHTQNYLLVCFIVT